MTLATKGLVGEENALADALAFVATLFPNDPAIVAATEACWSVVAAMCIKDIEGCPAVILEGPAASRKTTVLRFFGGLLADKGITYHDDKFTPASFVSHMASKTDEQLESIDLLPRIAHKVLVVPEMRVIFSDRAEVLAENLGVLTRVLDGHGYVSDSGAHGQRGYTGDFKFGLLGATTPLSDSAWQQMNNVGSRMLWLDMGGHEATVEELAGMLTQATTFETVTDIVCLTVSVGLLELWERTGGYGSVEWDRSAEPREAIMVAQLAKLTARLRGQIIRTDKYGESDNQTVQCENPNRLAVALMNIARGHALASGRTRVSEHDIPIVRRLALDTCPRQRRLAFRSLVDSEDGSSTTNDIERAVGCSKGTALRVMDELVLLGVAQWDNEHPGMNEFQAKQQPKRIALADEYKWLLSE